MVVTAWLNVTLLIRLQGDDHQQCFEIACAGGSGDVFILYYACHNYMDQYGVCTHVALQRTHRKLWSKYTALSAGWLQAPVHNSDFCGCGNSNSATALAWQLLVLLILIP